MKLMLLAVAAVGVVVGTNVPTCDECQTAAANLVEHLLGEESIGEQIAVLKSTVCPQVSNNLQIISLQGVTFWDSLIKVMTVIYFIHFLQ